jgi:hypothetical protein
MATKPFTSLTKHPELAQAIGIVIAEYSLLEFHMFLIYALARHPASPVECFAPYYSLRSMDKRNELVTEATHHLPPSHKKALGRLWRRFRSAARRRTEIAHASYMSDGKTLVRCFLRQLLQVISVDSARDNDSGLGFLYG